MEMPLADRVCNLECVKGPDAPTIKEFVGPVKIILVEEKKQVYAMKVRIASLVGFAVLLIGATNIIVMFFVSSLILTLYNNLHVFLCMAGFQLCFPLGILMTNSFHGPSAAMKAFERKCEHTVLLTFGMICCAGGIFSIFISGKFEFSAHCIAGIVAGGFAVLSAILGPCIFISKSKEGIMKVFNSVHVLFGILSLISSSVCFTLGLYKPSFTAWLFADDVEVFLIGFCIVYNIIIIIVSLRKCCGWGD